MSHRGEGSVYHDKPTPAKKMPGPPGPRPSASSTGKVPSDQQSPKETSTDPSARGGQMTEDKPVITPAAQALPNPSSLIAAVPPPPPPLPGKGNVGGAVSGTLSEMAKKMADAKDTHH